LHRDVQLHHRDNLHGCVRDLAQGAMFSVGRKLIGMEMQGLRAGRGYQQQHAKQRQPAPTGP
jgi:hypothetical protein